MTTRRHTLSAALAGISLLAWRRSGAQVPPSEAQPAIGTTKLFAIEFRTGPKWDATKQPHEQAHFREHSANLKRVRDAGSLLLGARYSDKGFLVVAAETETAARALIEADPSVQNQVFAYELFPFQVFYSGCVQAPKRAS
jgi:uncharacterized protein YciI